MFVVGRQQRQEHRGTKDFRGGSGGRNICYERGEDVVIHEIGEQGRLIGTADNGESEL